MSEGAIESGPLGDTGIEVTRMGLGMAALGRPGYINLGHSEDVGGDREVAAMRARACAVLDEALERGIRYFDMARSYGRAEEFVAAWMSERGIDPGSVRLASKWGYVYTADWRVQADAHEIKHHDLETFERQWRETRSGIGTPDVYQIHSATFESGVLDDAAVLGRLARLKAEGVFVGASVSGPAQGEVVRRAIDIEIDGVRLFDTIQATWNLLERSAENALKDAHARGVGVIIKEALANGRLTARGGLEMLDSEARRHGFTADALALSAALARPWAHVVLSGAATVEHLRSNLQAFEVPWDDDCERRLAGLEESSADYWSARGALPWN